MYLLKDKIRKQFEENSIALLDGVSNLHCTIFRTFYGLVFKVV